VEVSKGAEVTPGRKDDGGKSDLALVPFDALLEVGHVLGFGARKYQDRSDNWSRVAGGRDRYTSALLRHVAAWRLGERNDPETGRHHLAHAVCCGMFLLARELRNIDT
jgi:hypothetical protein